MNYTVYDPTTGIIEYSVSYNDNETAELNLVNKTYINGLYNNIDYYIYNGQAVPKGQDPSTHNLQYNFDYTTKTWQLIYDYTNDNARQQRNNLLSAVDRVNPVWYASLTESQQHELQVYRQALLDIPQQTGFPESVEWPAKPTWL
jgi:hypothetical protein